MPPLAALLLLLFAGAATLQWAEYVLLSAEDASVDGSNVLGALNMAVHSEASGLLKASYHITQDTATQQALRGGDWQQLLNRWQPMYEDLRREAHLRYMGFLDKDRVCILRLHEPGKRGDRIDRFLALEAERTGKAATGLQLGTLDTLTVRVVEPVFSEGVIIGYLEIGVEVTETLESIRTWSGCELAVLVSKEFLSRAHWERGMKHLDQETEWDRIPSFAIIYASGGRLPDTFAQAAAQSLSHGMTPDEVCRYLKVSGTYWRLLLEPFKDASGQQIGHLLVMRDTSAERTFYHRLAVFGGLLGILSVAILLIVVHSLLRRTDTAIHAQQESLRESESRLSAITQSAQDAILMMDEQGRISFWNPAAETIFGYTREEALGQNLHQLLAPAQYQELHQAAFAKFQETGEGNAVNKTLELQALRKNGDLFFAELSLAPIQLGGGWQAVGIVRDITERKKAEETLAASERYFRALIEKSNDGLCLLDANFNILYQSPSVLQLQGHTPEERHGRHGCDLVHPEDLPEVCEALETLRQTPGATAKLTARLQHKDGSWRWQKAFLTNHLDDPTINAIVVNYVDITERKQIEEALRESEGLLRSLANNLPTGVLYRMVANKDGLRRFTYVSEAVARVNEVSAESVLADANVLYSQIMPEYRGVLAKTETDLPDSGGTFHFEFQGLLPSGRIRWFEVSSVVHPTPSGEYITEGVLLDITDRKQVESALLEGEQRMRTLANNLPTAMLYQLTISPSGERRFTYVSEAVTRTNEVSVEAVLADAQVLYGQVSPELLPALRVAEETAFRERTSLRCEFSSQLPSGRLRWFEVSASIRAVADGTLLSEGVQLDITDRKRIESALRDSEQRYRAVADNIYHWEYWLGPDLQLLYCSPACQRLTGYSAEEFLQEPGLWAAMVHPDDREHYVCHMAHEREFEEHETEFRIIRRDGTERWISHSCRRIADAAGRFLGYRACNRDITDHKRAEEERLDLDRRLQQMQKAESLARMAGAIAHHFNNQLQSVTGFLDIARQKTLPGSPALEFMDETAAAVRRAAEMSSLMLTYLGMKMAKLAPLDLAQACDERLRRDERNRPKNIQVVVTFPEQGPRVRGNDEQLHQVVSNLVTNAFEAIEPNPGVVRVTVTAVFAADISTENRFPVDWRPQAETYACLEVTDTGCGVGAEELANIFDPFYSSKFVGRGLGLAVVQGIVRTHRGVITVKSEPGNGSAFRVYLPITQEPLPRRPEPLPLAPGYKRGGKALLVDDDPFVRKTAHRQILQLGFEVLEAEDGVSALNLLEQHRDAIRFVLCDVSMPRMDGWETLAAFKKAVPGIPFLMASGFNKTSVMEGEHAYMPELFLKKPYRPEDLLDALQRILPEYPVA